MKTLDFMCISDTHGKHGWLTDTTCDVLIHSGDAANPRDPHLNNNEMVDFLDWFSAQPAKYKIYVPGNHDTSIEKGLVTIPSNVILLDHKEVTIEGFKIFGSPYTPEFGHGWAYNVDRRKLDDVWQDIPDDTDILITHGPPKTILDLTARDGSYFQCGCQHLLRRVLQIEPFIHQFGHIHSESTCINGGTFVHPSLSTKFVNASVVDINHNFVHDGIRVKLDVLNSIK
jgi:Icc-related predicted phosphoesterase